MLKDLKDAGYKLCVISDAAYVDIAGWNKSPLAKYFDKTVFSCEVGYIKPDPRLFETAKQMMGHPTECIFVGDGGHEELMGAQSVGMKTIKAEWINNRRVEEIYQYSNYRVQETESMLTVVKEINFDLDKNMKAKDIKETIEKPEKKPDIDEFLASFDENKNENKKDIIEKNKDEVDMEL